MRIAPRDLCGLFISVFENRVFLIHQTPKEFLVQSEQGRAISTTDFWRNSLIPAESDLVILKSCLWYLSFERFELPQVSLKLHTRDESSDLHENGPVEHDRVRSPKREGNLIEVLLNEWPHKDMELKVSLRSNVFLEYCGKYWATHFKSIGYKEESLVELASRICDTRSTSCILWPAILLGDGFTGLHSSKWTINLKYGPTFALAFVGIEKLVGRLVSLDIDINCFNADNETPLAVAVRKGRLGVV